MATLSQWFSVSTVAAKQCQSRAFSLSILFYFPLLASRGPISKGMSASHFRHTCMNKEFILYIKGN
jgi:hypothetical protein